MNTLYGIVALLLASGILTWLTESSGQVPIPSVRRKKKKKLRMRDMQPYLKDDGLVVVNSTRPDQEAEPAPKPQETQE